MAEEKLDPQKADVKIIFHNPDDYNEVDNYFMDNYDLESQGINPLDLDQVKAAKIKLSSDYFNTKLIEPEEQATPAVGGVAAGPGFVPFPYQFDTAGLKKFLVDTGNATLENIAQLTKSGVDFLFGEPGEIGSQLNTLQDWVMSKVGKDLTDEEKASIGETVLKFGGKSLATVDQLIDLLDELPDYESVKGFTDNFIKNLSQDTAMQEQVANFIDTQDERKIQQLGGAIVAGELTPRLFRGAVKGAQVLKPKVLEFVEEGIDAFEDFFGMKKFAVPKDKKGVAPRKKPNASFTGTLSEFDETAAETKPGFVKDRSLKGNIYKTNLITNDLDDPNPLMREKWTWVTPVDDYKNARQIISIEGSVKGESEKHFFTLQANFPTGAKLANYVRKPAPNLRPTTQGELQFGKQIGSVRIGLKKDAKIHPVYDEITLTNNVPIKEIQTDERPIIPAPKKLFRDKKTKEAQSFMGLNQFEREFDTGEFIDPVDKKIITNQFIQNGTVKINKDVDIADQPNNQPTKTEVSENVAPTTTDNVLINKEKMIGTAIPKTVNRDVVNTDNVVNFDSFFNDNAKRSQNIKLFNLSPSIKIKGVTKASARKIVDQLKDNLRFVYDVLTPQKLKDEAKQWYDGANKIAKELAAKYNLTDEQTSAIIATLSPQKVWNENVSLAERVIEILTNKKDFKLDEKAKAKIQQLYNPNTDVYYKIQYGTTKKQYNLTKEKSELNKRINQKLDNLSLDDISNLKLEGLSLEDAQYRKAALKSLLLRVIDETYLDRSFKKVNVDGTRGDVVKTDKGVNANAAWKDYDSIGRAVEIFEDGSIENINITVGDGHKVRSFFNNIVNPNADDIVTIDTHAVAAAHLRPLSAGDIEPNNAFGQHKKKKYKTKLPGPAENATTGEKGTYSFYQQAYNELAKEYGLLARQMQSIVWESIREFYPKNFKNETTKIAIDNIWKKWKSGKISAEEARQEIVDYRNKNIGGKDEGS